EILAGLLHTAERREAGVEAGFFEVELPLAELGGERGDAHVLAVGFHGADGAANGDEDVLVDLTQAGLGAVEIGERLPMPGAVGGQAPGHAEADVEWPGLTVAGRERFERGAGVGLLAVQAERAG